MFPLNDGSQIGLIGNPIRIKNRDNFFARLMPGEGRVTDLIDSYGICLNAPFSENYGN
jgi:hypothetical protein